MTLRIPSLAALPLCIAATAALAAPPLSIPFSRPTPEQDAQMVAESEEALRLAELEESEFPRAEDPAPAVPAVEPSEAPAAPVAAPPPPVAAPETPAPSVEPAPRPASGAPRPEDIPVFRRDPFWPAAIVRERKEQHDARVAARIEAEKRAAAIQKAREEAIRKGLDVEEMDDDELVNLGGGASAAPAGPKASSNFGGATGEEWEAALAKIPPRSGYLGGRKPALMLKGDKTPHYVGDRLCVTNRNVVFTWRVSSIDFRSYTHELKRVSAKPVP